MIFAQLIVVVFFTYYILIDDNEFITKAMDRIPGQKREIAPNFLQELNNIYTTLSPVYFTISMLSGVLMAVDFFMLGVLYPVELETVVGVFTLIPMLGPSFVFVSMALCYLFRGDMIRFLIILVFGTIVLMMIPENVIRLPIWP